MHKHLPTRWDAKGAWYFVTVVTHDRYPYFQSEEACTMLMDACHSVRQRHGYRLGALVIMPDHWHALIKPLDNEVIESIVGSIKQRVFHASRGTAAVEGGATKGGQSIGSAAYHGGANTAYHGGANTANQGGAKTANQGGAMRAAQGEHKIIRWQKRFMDHRIRNEKDYFQHLEYMRLNPYKHQLVNDEKEPWRWFFVHKDPFGFKNTGGAAFQGGAGTGSAAYQGGAKTAYQGGAGTAAEDGGAAEEGGATD